MAAHNELGKTGELLAANYLKQQGYIIRETNYRFQKAEVDIIASKGNILAAVEVKTRASSYYGQPHEFISREKIRLLTKAINHYIIEQDLDHEVRFDVIGIVKTHHDISITHLQDAFYHF
ncbi:YraN family protein [Lutimonas sp.]|uniref:YraN family protein n=1 Tax=Lutimonas sp. TaxID=1872403 RepID=UPI003D9B5547